MSFSEHTRVPLDLNAELESVDVRNKIGGIQNLGNQPRLGSIKGGNVIASTQPRQSTPAHVTAVQARVFQTSTDVSQIHIVYKRPPNDPFHRITKIHVSGYKGNAQPVQVASGHSPISFSLENTGERVSITAQASGDLGDAFLDSAPTVALALSRNPSLPGTGISASAQPGSPSAISAVATPLGNQVSWTGPSGPDTHSHQIYRATSNSFAAASRVATVAFSPAGQPAFVDKNVTVGTQYWYFVSTVNKAFVESLPSASVSATAAAANLDTHVIDGTARKARTAGHSSYRPTSNPITATDAGSNATVSIASHTMRVGGSSISNNSGSVSGLSYGTLYYIFYDDANFAGGAVTYQSTTTKETALNGDSRFFVGSVTTPPATGADTMGNNDGGTGAQSGFFGVFRPTVNVNGSNLSYDGDTTTVSTVTDNDTLISSITQSVSGISNPTTGAQAVISAVLNIRSRIVKINGAGANSTGSLDYSKDGGSTWTNVYTVTGTTARAVATDAITLPAGQVLSRVQVRQTATYIAGAHTTSVSAGLFEVWVEVQS
jgi:hypothetical protein